MTWRTAILCLAVLLIGSASPAQDGLALMKVEPGAGLVGMGGAGVSLAGDPNSVFYNPASAVDVEQIALSFGHNTYWDNIHLETGYLVSNLNRKVNIHAGIRYAAVDEIESRLRPTTEPDAYFSAYDVSFKGGLTYQISDKLYAGAAMGWYIEKIDIYRGSALNLDFGTLYKYREDITLGASITNIGSDLSLAVSGKDGTEGISLPITYRAGGSYRYDRYVGALDLVILDDDFHMHIGAEGNLHESISVRAGYMIGYDSKDITAGASFMRRNFSIDYAFVPYSSELGTSHLFNLTLTL